MLTSDRSAGDVAPTPGTMRLLPYSGSGRRAAALAPAHAVHAAQVTRRVLAALRPELLFVWNATAVPTAAVRVALDHGVPAVHRLCERWFAERILLADQFGRHMAPGARGLRAIWGGAVRAANHHPELRLDMRAPYPAAVSWNSDALRRSVALPSSVHPVLERTIHPATPNGEYFGTLTRSLSEQPSLIFVGRVGAQKGADTAVRSLAALSATHGIDALLVMVGPYEDAARTDVESLAAALGVAGRVRLRGRLDRHQLGEELRAAHAMLAPSREEAFGLACVEAAWARVPVVASRVGGIPEALREHEHALLFEPADADEAAAALARTLTMPRETSERVSRAFARAQEFSVARYLAATDEFLDDALAAHRDPARL